MTRGHKTKVVTDMNRLSLTNPCKYVATGDENLVKRKMRLHKKVCVICRNDTKDIENIIHSYPNNPHNASFNSEVLKEKNYEVVHHSTTIV